MYPAWQAHGYSVVHIARHVCLTCPVRSSSLSLSNQHLLKFHVLSAESANVVLLNEIGLDPGIDHCSALSLLKQLERENKRVLSFTSFCGGLPAPEASDVPLGYKFSWSPRGVLNAALNGAKFKLNGKVRANAHRGDLVFV